MVLRCSPALAAAPWARALPTLGLAALPRAQLSLQPHVQGHGLCPAEHGTTAVNTAEERGPAGWAPKAVLLVTAAERKGGWTLGRGRPLLASIPRG